MLTVITSDLISAIDLAVVPGQRPLHGIADHVQQRPMHFLHARRRRRRHIHLNRRGASDPPQRAPAAGRPPPPPPPVSAIVCKPAARAASSAASTLGDPPLVLMPNATSPGRPRASTCRTNTRAWL